MNYLIRGDGKTTPFTEAERATLLKNDYEMNEPDGATYFNGYRKIVKKDENFFVLYSWMDDDDDGGCWEEWGDVRRTLDFL